VIEGPKRSTVELSDKHPIFIGFKLDGTLRHQLDTLSGPDRKYVSHDDMEFLTFCKKGQTRYVGKLIEGRMTTDRVDDVRRNVLSIIARLCPEVRLPQVLDIWVGLPDHVEEVPVGEGRDAGAKVRDSGPGGYGTPGTSRY
jgi:hypothetical protein